MATPLQPIQVSPNKGNNDMLSELVVIVKKSFESEGKIIKDLYKKLETSTKDIYDNAERIREQVKSTTKDIGKKVVDSSKEIKEISKKQGSRYIDYVKSEFSNINKDTSSIVKGVAKVNKDSQSQLNKMEKMKKSFTDSANRGDVIINDIKELGGKITNDFFKSSQVMAKRLAVLKEGLLSRLSNIGNISKKDIFGGLLKLLMNPMTWAAIGGFLLSAIGLNPSMLKVWKNILVRISEITKGKFLEKFSNKFQTLKDGIGGLITKVKTFFKTGMDDLLSKAKSGLSSLKYSDKSMGIASKVGKTAKAISNVTGVSKVASKAVSIGKGVVDVAMSITRTLGGLFKGGGGGTLMKLAKPFMGIATKILGKIPIFGQIFTIGQSMWAGYKAVFGEGSDPDATFGEKIWVFAKTAISTFLKSFTEIPSAIGDIFGFIFGKEHPIAKTMKKTGDVISGTLGSWIDNVFGLVENLFSLSQNVGGMISSLMIGDWAGVKTHFSKFLDSGWESIKSLFMLAPLGVFTDVINRVFDFDIIKTTKGLIGDVSNWIKDKIYPLMGNFKEIGDIFSTFWSSLKGNGGGLVSDILQGNWTGVKDHFWAMVGSFDTVISDLKTSVISLFTNISTQQWYIDYIQPIVDTVSSIFSSIKNNIQPLLDVYTNLTEKATGLIGAIFKGDWKLALDEGKGLMSSIVTYPLDLIKGFAGVFTNITEKKWFQDYIISPLSGIGDWIGDKLQSLQDYIIIKVGEVTSFFGGESQAVKDAKARTKEREIAALENKKKEQEKTLGVGKTKNVDEYLSKVTNGFTDNDLQMKLANRQELKGKNQELNLQKDAYSKDVDVIKAQMRAKSDERGWFFDSDDYNALEEKLKIAEQKLDKTIEEIDTNNDKIETLGNDKVNAIEKNLDTHFQGQNNVDYFQDNSKRIRLTNIEKEQSKTPVKANTPTKANTTNNKLNKTNVVKASVPLTKIDKIDNFLKTGTPLSDAQLEYLHRTKSLIESKPDSDITDEEENTYYRIEEMIQRHKGNKLHLETYGSFRTVVEAKPKSSFDKALENAGDSRFDKALKGDGSFDKALKKAGDSRVDKALAKGNSSFDKALKSDGSFDKALATGHSSVDKVLKGDGSFDKVSTYGNSSVNTKVTVTGGGYTEYKKDEDVPPVPLSDEEIEIRRQLKIKTDATVAKWREKRRKKKAAEAAAKMNNETKPVEGIPSLRRGGITSNVEKEIPATLHKNEAVVSDLESPRGDEWVDKICDKLVDKMKYNLQELNSSEGISIVLSLLQDVISGQNNIQGLISSINNRKDDVYNNSKHFHSMSNSIIGL